MLRGGSIAIIPWIGDTHAIASPGNVADSQAHER